jgi:hypothetical protein
LTYRHEENPLPLLGAPGGAKTFNDNVGMGEPAVRPFPLSRNPPGSEAPVFPESASECNALQASGGAISLPLVHPSREADAAVKALLTKTSTTLDSDIARQRPECGRPSS